MSLRIPDHQHEALGHLLSLTEDQWNRVLKALEEETPAFPASAYTEKLASRLKGRIKSVEGLLELLSSIFGIRDRYSGPTDQLLSEIQEAAKITGKRELQSTPENWKRFQKFVSQLLYANTSLETISKAQEVLNEEERIFIDARVVSNLRPIFSQEVEARPKAFVVTHSLRIAYYQAGSDGPKEFYVALDADDLRAIQKVMLRGLKKEVALSSLAEKWSVPVLSKKGDL
jgi:hypothetical protein